MDKSLPTVRATALDSLARKSAQVLASLLPGELDFHAMRLVELKTEKGEVAASTYLDSLDIKVSDQHKIHAKASDFLAELAQRNAEGARALSIARHDHMYAKSMQDEEYSNALKAQAGIDRITGTNTTNDQSEAISTGILDIMKAVYNSDDKSA